MSDPPYLNMDTAYKVIETTKLLTRDVTTPFIMINGAQIEEPISQAFKLRKLKFEPSHTTPLLNKLYCYSNYESVRLGGYDTPISEIASSSGEGEAKSEVKSEETSANTSS
eukprot:GILI01058138.1.p1 GENE.GILI01058138.1~~GILI01058138.1.p1  ORF type:complete len:124 (-),score=21.46 GILI01058138.1:7-339(-)